jgi:shikimate kinase
MGSGKSTVGARLAKRLNFAFIDADTYLEQQMGVSIPTMFAMEGEDGFRLREAKVIAELVKQPNIILATGGGAVLREDSRHALHHNGWVAYLSATPEQIWQRLRYDRSRPLLQNANPFQTLSALHEQRQPLYQACAHATIMSGSRSVIAIVHDLLAAYQQDQKAQA